MGILQQINQWAGKAFAPGVLMVACLAYFSPQGFIWIVPHISLLLGIIMVGIGMTMSLDDFAAVFRQPKQVVATVLAQFTIMPLLAFGLAAGFHLPPEIAAGVILVGCCPGGTASNVMTYLARGNVPLSVAATSVSTLLAPFVTPALTLLLAAKWLPVSAAEMFISVIKIVVFPIIAGIAVKKFFPRQVELSLNALPLVSMVAIVAIVAAVIGANQARLAEVGLIVLAVVVLHNVLGYALGYGVARLFKFDFADVKAVAIEVGMQNSGLGAALAATHFTPLAAVPSAIFSVWHNISGSLLANRWGNHHAGVRGQGRSV